VSTLHPFGKPLGVALLALSLSACSTLSQQQIDPSDSFQQAIDSTSLRAQVGALAQPLVDGKRTPGIVVGGLGWDDNLEQLLPAGTPLSEDARHITLLQLATHSAGLTRQPAGASRAAQGSAGHRLDSR